MQTPRAAFSLQPRQLPYDLLSFEDLNFSTDGFTQGITAGGSSMAYSVTKSAGMPYFIL